MDVSCLLLFLASICKFSGGQNITVSPRNSAATADSTITLQCGFTTSPAPTVKWREYILNPTTGNVISSNGINNPTYPNATRLKRYNTTNPKAGQYNLLISPFTEGDAGYYSCSGNAYEDQYGAYVMYLGTSSCSILQNGTNVSVVIKGEEFALRCKQTYKSFPGWPPILGWDDLGSIEARNFTTENEAHYEIDLIAQEGMNEKTYACTTSFSDPPPFRPPSENKMDDRGKPAFSGQGCETKMIVHWGPMNITIFPRKTVFEVGEQITCLSSANPPPTEYKWTRKYGPGPELVEAQNFTIRTEMTKGACAYECEVTNIVKGTVNRRKQLFIFYVQSASRLSAGAIAGIVIIGMLVY